MNNVFQSYLALLPFPSLAPVPLSPVSFLISTSFILYGGGGRLPVCFIRLGCMSAGEACFQERGHFTSDYTTEENISPSPINYQVYINPQGEGGRGPGESLPLP